MKIIFDENFSPSLAKGFSEFEKGFGPSGFEIFHITDLFDRGEKDHNWIPKVGQMRASIITQDFNIYQTSNLVELCKQYKVGIFFFKTPSKKGYKFWEWILNIVKKWEEM